MNTFKCSIVAAVLLVSAASVSAHTEVNPGFNLFSTSQDVEVGRQSAAAVDRQLPMLSSSSAPATTRLIERLGQRLAANAPGANYPYRFRLVNLADVNAFALPGGFIYVHRGLVERVRNEGELAAVMAHEIAHVALRHPTHQASKAYVAQTGLGLLNGILGGSSRSRTNGVMAAVGGLGLNALFLRFSRSAEEEADAVGAEIMARSGYDPMAMADFFGTLRHDAGRDPGRFETFLSSHPAAASREAHIRAEARAMSRARSSAVGGLSAAQAEMRRLPKARTMSQMSKGS